MVPATCATLADHSIPKEKRWTLLIDFENRFNQVDHSIIIADIRDHFPQLSRWVESFYGATSNLTFGEAVLQSMRGVQQGDTLRPLLFVLLLQPILMELPEVEGLRLNV